MTVNSRNPLNSIHKTATSLLVLALLALASSIADSAKEPDAGVATISGNVKLPETLAKGINASGLSLADTIVILEGKYSHLRRPYPENWKGMTRERGGSIPSRTSHRCPCA